MGYVDLRTGSGAVALALVSAHPGATVLGTDVDPTAVACARTNGIRALEGDLDAPLPASVLGWMAPWTTTAKAE